jgi:imidazolonepropionase-like amidohydrolase
MTNYLITGGILIDATGAAPKKGTSLFVTGNRIAKIGTPPDTKGFADRQGPYEVINAEGRTIMPGMIDCHVHPSYGDILTAEELEIYCSAEYRTLRSALAIRKVLRAGITSIATPGGNWNINVALRDAVNAGLIEGPRIAAGGHYITTYNALGSIFPTHIAHPPSSFSVLCNTRDEMVAQVRKEVKDGVDIIKVAGDGDTLSTSGRLLGSISYDDLKAIADATHLVGKRCTIHARSGRVSADAARAGFDWIIHGSYMTDEDLAVLIEHGTPINPTLSLLANTLDWGPDLGLQPAVMDGYKHELDAASKILSKAYKAGLMIMAGTDSGQSSVPSGEWHAREMEHLITYLGMSNMDALLAGTRNAAFATGMQDKIGTLEEGKFADILVVDGNPLEDITVLQDKARLLVIMKNGEIVDTRTPLPQPTIYAWERAFPVWTDTRLPTQDFVRRHATRKPQWMTVRQTAAE